MQRDRRDQAKRCGVGAIDEALGPGPALGQVDDAVEQRNTARLLMMADKSYYEDGGNVDASDDLDYDGLKDYLEKEFSKTLAIRYEIHYRRVSEGRKNTLLVDYTYSASYKIPTVEGDVWRRRVADNRMELARDGEGFRILSGM